MTGHNFQREEGRTFHYFSRLPAELRWKIWEYNLPGPRLVSIRCGSDDLGLPSSSSDGPGRTTLFSSSSSSPFSSPGCTSPARLPANLHACHEARREALRHYQPAFGIAHQPSQIFFAPTVDILYFGPRDGFMAAEAQLRTVLTLCDPAELACVRKVALNDAVFWSASSAATASSSPVHYSQRMVASSLLVDVLELLRARMPGLRELVFVPRDENPLYSGDACLVEPTMAQSRLARVVHEAMDAVFGADSTVQQRPWNWKIMTLSADADVPVYGRRVMGWDAAAEDEDVVYGNAHGPGYNGDAAAVHGCGGSRLRRGCGGGSGAGVDSIKSDWATILMPRGAAPRRMSALQESVRQQFTLMEMGVHAVPVLVE